jgi:hypothetical protein
MKATIPNAVDVKFEQVPLGDQFIINGELWQKTGETTAVKVPRWPLLKDIVGLVLAASPRAKETL